MPTTGRQSISDLLAGIAGVSQVFDDGLLRPLGGHGRIMSNVPFVELVETEVTTESTSSNSRMRTSSVTGRLVIMRNRDDYNVYLDRLIGAFRSRSRYPIQILQETPHTPRTIALNFSVGFFLCEDK